jgi:DNA-binding response OmpR family regulator
MRIVVVDEDPDTVVAILGTLRDNGYDARGFSSARAALNAMPQLNPDVVISMPSTNGCDVAREARRLLGETRPLLIGIKAGYRKTTDMADFNFFLSKPCDPKVVLELVRTSGA